MQIQPIFSPKKRPVLIAGPCSAETEEQVFETAKQLADQPIDLFRAGIWKPRTRPDSFEGVGVKGLPWLSRVRSELGMKVTTEVANARHVYEALKHRIDVLWIGARTTVNPFAVQEIADALQGIDIPVLIKNPINPDLKLWLGAIERIHKAGVSQIAVIHRGFSYHGNTQYRNIPRWQIPIELKRQLPDIEIICDNSHICGRRDTLQAVAQQALDLQFDGLMTEVHPNPDEAWSDAQQQITPQTYRSLADALVLRKDSVDDPGFNAQLAEIRRQIDELDEELLHMIGNRMQLAKRIGQIKLENDIAILQTNRWNEILERGEEKGAGLGLSGMFVRTLLKAIHQESINHQEQVMTEGKTSVASEK